MKSINILHVYDHRIIRWMIPPRKTLMDKKAFRTIMRHRRSSFVSAISELGEMPPPSGEHKLNAKEEIRGMFFFR